MRTLFIAAVLGALGVVLGAFGAHGLKAVLMPDKLAAFQTGVTYQFYHAIALLGVGILEIVRPDTRWKWVRLTFLVGVIFFSGSLYILAPADYWGIAENVKFLGPITPLGGLSFIIGWVMVAIISLKPQQAS